MVTRLRSAVAEPWWQLPFLAARLLDDEGRRLWIEESDTAPREEMTCDRRPVFVRVRVPTLLFYGFEDAGTPIGPSIEA